MFVQGVLTYFIKYVLKTTELLMPFLFLGATHRIIRLGGDV